MNVKEAADVLGVPTREVLALVDAGLLPDPDDTDNPADPDLNDDSVYRLCALLSMGRRNRKTP